MATGLLLSGTIAALLTSVLPAQHQPSGGFEDPPPDKIVIKVATVNGSGCPQGTAAVAVSEDNTAFTVTYSDYLAQAGGDSPPTAFRKNCQLNLLVHVPQGFTYAVAGADYRGFAPSRTARRAPSGPRTTSRAPRTRSTAPTPSRAPSTTTGRPPTAPTGPSWSGRPAESSATSTSTRSCG